MVSCPGIPSGNLICLSISLCIFNYARESINSFLDKTQCLLLVACGTVARKHLGGI